jgi:hypothetical protein
MDLFLFAVQQLAPFRVLFRAYFLQPLTAYFIHWTPPAAHFAKGKIPLSYLAPVAEFPSRGCQASVQWRSWRLGEERPVGGGTKPAGRPEAAATGLARNRPERCPASRTPGTSPVR